MNGHRQPRTDSERLYIVDKRKSYLISALSFVVVSLILFAWAFSSHFSFANQSQFFAFAFGFVMLLMGLFTLVGWHRNLRFEFHHNFVRVFVGKKDTKDIPYSEINFKHVRTQRSDAVCLEIPSQGKLFQFNGIPFGWPFGYPTTEPYVIGNDTMSNEKSSLYEWLTGPRFGKTPTLKIVVPRFWSLSKVLVSVFGCLSIIFGVGYFWTVPDTPTVDFIAGFLFVMIGTVALSTLLWLWTRGRARAVRAY